MTPAPLAKLDILTVGYATHHVASTCTLIRDGEKTIVVDPGMVADRSLLLDPLSRLGVGTADVTDVVISHHHPDHTLNVALFPKARVHDVFATYDRDLWIDHDPGDFVVSPSVGLTPTPGHTDQDLTTLVHTEAGLIALTHLWWDASGPADDPFAPDQTILSASRKRILAMGPALIVPGHGAAFAPTADTPS